MNKAAWMFLLGIVFLGIALASITVKKVVKEGDTVTVNYTLVLDDESVYYTTIGIEPLQVTLGQGILIPSFEEAVVGMRVGDSKIIRLLPEQAYGPYRPDLVEAVERSWLPENVTPEIGMQLQTELVDGTKAIAVITEFTEATVTLDANHPLAGQNLTFEIELMALREGPIPSDNVNQTYLSWLLLVLGILASGFAFFYIRSRHSFPGIRLPGSPRRSHSAGYRTR